MATEWTPYTLSPEALAFLEEGEGNMPFIYDDRTSKKIHRWSDAKGFPTVGLGVKINQVDRPKFERWLGKTIPREELDRINADKLASKLALLNKKLEEEKFPGPNEDIHLSDGAFAVLFSYAWNTGTGSPWFKRLLQIYKTGDVEAAAAHIRTGPVTSEGVWNRGLAKRRNHEADHLLKFTIMNRRPYIVERPLAGALLIFIPLLLLGATAHFAYRRVKAHRSALRLPPTGSAGGKVDAGVGMGMGMKMDAGVRDV